MPTEITEITSTTTLALGSFLSLFVIAFFVVWSIEAGILTLYDAKA